MEKRKNILKEAVVFLIVVSMLLSIAVMATSTQVDALGSPKSEMNCMISSGVINIVVPTWNSNILYRVDMYWQSPPFWDIMK